jgi:crotonobetainyl-CoA:carnitine CoA-transferase CaiB-like acyl-CoA transferase
MLQPLSGLRVIDFTTLLPGPLATLMLAEAGAEVIKIEPPEGESMRFYPPYFGQESAVFAMLNRGKTGLALDLKSAEGLREALALIEAADIVVEQFRPGVMARLGLGYDDARRVNSRIVYCSITGYGQTGPRAQEAGHDLNYIGNTGLLALATGDPPVVPPALIADIGGGTFPAVINILLALRHRDLTGAGCHLDIAMSDAMFTFAWHALASGPAGAYPGAGEAMLAGGSPRYQLYRTKDGRLVACAALEQKFWRAFCAAIGLEDALVNDGANPAATRHAVAGLIASRTAAEWQPVFAAADCCVTVVMPLEQAVADPHFVERGLFAHRVAVEHATMTALPVPIDAQFRGDVKTPKPFPARNRKG